MLPKFRTSKRKGIFRMAEHLQQQLTSHETAAALRCYENEGTHVSNQSKKKGNENNPDCIDMYNKNSVPGSPKFLTLYSSTLIIMVTTSNVF